MERRPRTAVKWGFIFGAVLAVLSLARTGLSLATGAGRVGGLRGLAPALGCVAFLIGLAIFFVAGLLAARDDGRAGSGALAGLIAGLVWGVVTAAVAIPVAASTVASNPALVSSRRMPPGQTHAILVIAFVFVAIIILLGGAGVGAGLAALGGLVGRSQFQQAHPMPLMTESYYTPAAPMPGYPQMPQGYPPAPGYGQAPQPTAPYDPGYGRMPEPGYPPAPPQYPPQSAYPQAPGVAAPPSGSENNPPQQQ